MTLLHFLIKCDANFYTQYALPLICADPNHFDLDGFRSYISNEGLIKFDSVDSAFKAFEQDKEAQYELDAKYGSRYVWDIADQWYQKWNVVFSLEHMWNWTPERRASDVLDRDFDDSGGGASRTPPRVVNAAQLQPWLCHIAERHVIHPDHILLLEKLCHHLVNWHQANRPLVLVGAIKLNSIPFFPPSWFVDKIEQKPGSCEGLAPSYVARFAPPYCLADTRVPGRWDRVFLKGIMIDPNHQVSVATHPPGSAANALQFDIDPGLIASKLPIYGLTVHYVPALGYSQLMMVMKKATYGNLEDSLQNETPVDYRKPLKLALTITKAVKDLHWEYIHGNVHPRNILFDWTDDWGELTDITFMQRITRRSERKFGSCCGRWPYVAPEVASTGLSTAADIYALGIILWQLISRVTFPDQALVDPHIYRIEPIPGVMKEWEELYTDCLNSDPAKRPNAYTVYRRLQEISANAPMDSQTLDYIHQRRCATEQFLHQSRCSPSLPCQSGWVGDMFLTSSVTRLVNQRFESYPTLVQNFDFTF